MIMCDRALELQPDDSGILDNRAYALLRFGRHEEAMANWYEVEKSGKRGSCLTYSKSAIEACLTVKMLFKLPLRQTEGFVNSLFEMMQIAVSAPD